jgi:hypothetical protein
MVKIGLAQWSFFGCHFYSYFIQITWNSISPYFLTLIVINRINEVIEHAEIFYNVCVRAAQDEMAITYREVLDELGYGPQVSGQAIRYGLELA